MAIVDDIKSALRLSGDALTARHFYWHQPRSVTSCCPASLKDYGKAPSQQTILSSWQSSSTPKHISVSTTLRARGSSKSTYQIEKDLSIHGDGVVDDVVV